MGRCSAHVNEYPVGTGGRGGEMAETQVGEKNWRIRGGAVGRESRQARCTESDNPDASEESTEKNWVDEEASAAEEATERMGWAEEVRWKMQTQASTGASD
ncbi:hypothetical protein MTO96_005501 [Rhipicephalus appendiculatus]